MIGLFDSHNHLDYPEFEGDRVGVMQRAAEAGIVGCLVAGVSWGQWARLERLAQQDSGVVVSLGVHPWYAARLSEADWPALERDLTLRSQQSFVVAIGECGLDRVAERRRGVAFETQVRVFRRQLQLAVALQMPVILHVVRAHSEALALLRECGPLPAGGVVHGFTAGPEVCERYTAQGLSCGIGTAVLSARAHKLHATVRHAPLQSLLLETDAPDQPPRGWPQRHNEPRSLLQVAQAVAALRGLPVETVAQQTTANARALFGMPEV